MMNPYKTCRDCIHEKICKYADKKISTGTSVREIIHECKDYKPIVDVAEVNQRKLIYFGNYLKYKDGDEEKAKELLKKQLHGLIDGLCERDDFWIKVEGDASGKDLLGQTNSIAWKIVVPHMEDKDWLNNKTGEEDNK